MPRTFRVQQKVLFQHCDPAGIVFYPRYLEMVNALVEQWFEEALGVSFAEKMARREGLPAAYVAVSFIAPSYLGDLLELRLSVVRVGRSSLSLRITANGLTGRGGPGGPADGAFDTSFPSRQAADRATETGSADNGNDVRMEADLTVVHIRRPGQTPQPWPEDLKTRMRAFMSEGRPATPLAPRSR